MSDTNATPDARKLCTCDGAGRGPGRACVVKAGGRLGELWRCAQDTNATPGDGVAPEIDPERGWSRDRPTSGGRWLWREGWRAPVALRLTDNGCEVSQQDGDDFEGSPQDFWEQTPTDQSHMPGWWKRG